MRMSELFNSGVVASRWTDDVSTRTADMGAALFPSRKKMGLDIKEIRGHKGLPVSLAPSNFDAASTLRAREGFKVNEREMAFFRESMLVKEREEQEVMRVQDANDPYAKEVLDRIYDDASTLLAGADVVAERMRMQLLCPEIDGSPRILISSDGKQYAYNYDEDGSYAANNYKELSGTSAWTDHASADPLTDLGDAIQAVVALTGSRPALALMNSVTFKHLKQIESVRSAILAQNVSANVYLNDARVKDALRSEVDLGVAIYDKQYKDENGSVHKYFKDGYVALIPEGALGTTWYGTTPEERTLKGSGEADVTVLDSGVAIAVKITEDPVNTKTTVSEILLPSYERMAETYVLKVF